MKKIKLNKLILLIFSIAVILIAVLILYKPAYKISSEEIQDYKASLFNSIYCQYSCPLEYITFQNQTQILPSQQCVQKCINDLKLQGYNNTKYSDSDIIRDDNLVIEITSSIDSCSSENPANFSSSLVNNTLFVDCVKSFLEDIKSNYTYLN